MSAPPLRRIDGIARRLAGVRRPVLCDAGSSLSGSDLDAAVDAAADALARRGVRGGDRVVVLNENGAAAVVALLALSRLDAWSVIVNARLTPAEVDAIGAHCTPRLTLHAGEAAALHAARDGASPLALPGVGEVGATEPDAGSEPEPVEADAAAQIAALIYTSGTTGRPKGVMLTHANLLFVADVSGRVRGLGPDDRVYGVLPISHAFGLASTYLGTLHHGGCVLAVPRFDAGATARALAEGGVTALQGAPAMYARLLELAAARGRDLPAPRLRYLSAGGAPLDPTLKRRVEQMWGVPLQNGYGLTETAPTVAITRIDAPATDDTVGPPLPGVEVRVVGDDGEGVGELWVRGPNVMRGYYRDPEQTALALTPDGWFRTGDLGRIDPATGNVYVRGRLRELIIRSGFNVYPAEVEAVLNRHPDVALSAVVGRPAGDGNEEVVAFVQPVRGRAPDSTALAAFAADHLAPYKRPAAIVVLDALPATPMGKVLKARLRELAIAGAER